jgi:hypothetical protein
MSRFHPVKLKTCPFVSPPDMLGSLSLYVCIFAEFGGE